MMTRPRGPSSKLNNATRHGYSLNISHHKKERAQNSIFGHIQLVIKIMSQF